MTETTTREITTSSYERLAAEYYDATRHPTCANFREASRLLLERLLPSRAASRTCEVGAGDSLLAEILARRGQPLDGLLLTDAHDGMLEHSSRWAPSGARLELSSADALPVADGSQLLVVASLADPYDDERFWSEVSRVLAPGGRCVLTTPSWTWASRFRSDGLPSDVAEFELSSGESIYVPSYVRPVSDERQLVQSHGLEVITHDEIPLADVPEPISSKLRVLAADDPVVAGFVAEAH